MTTPKKAYRWERLGPTGKVLVALLLIVAGLSLIQALTQVRPMLWPEPVTDRFEVVFFRFAWSAMQPLLAIINLAVLATEVLWLIWQHRAHANLVARGVPGLRFTPGWSVAWWFIPIASLFQPFRAVRELDRTVGEGREPAVGDGWLWAWWLTYLAMGFAAFPAFFVFFGQIFDNLGPDGRLPEVVTITTDQVRTLAFWWFVAAVVRAVAAVLAIRVVQGISRAEDAEPPVQIASIGLPAPPRPDIR